MIAEFSAVVNFGAEDDEEGDDEDEDDFFSFPFRALWSSSLLQKHIKVSMDTFESIGSIKGIHGYFYQIRIKKNCDHKKSKVSMDTFDPL